MEALFYLMLVFCGALLLPLLATFLFYPIYKLFGGELTLGEILGGL